jgi:hypothetical protein
MHPPHPNWIRRWLGLANTARAATTDAASGDALPCSSSPVAARAHARSMRWTTAGSTAELVMDGNGARRDRESHPLE